MSTITEPIILNSTGKAMAAALTTIAHGYSDTLATDYATIQRLVRNGLAPQVFNIGDKINVPWSDGAATPTTRTIPFDVMHFGNVTLQDGEVVPGMFLQAHYSLPFGTQFDNYEAFYAAKTADLAAGTYYVTLGTSWGSNAVAGKSYQFTLANPLVKGGHLTGFYGMPDQAPANWKVYSWASQTATTATETVAVTEGTGGTFLGTIKFGGSDPINCMQRVAYGYNRWSQSAIRQWLNSSAAANAWWSPKNDFDHFPDYLARPGFLTGFGDAFLNVLGKPQMKTCANYLTDGGTADAPTIDITYDTFFLPSLEQHFITPQQAAVSGIEGDAWEYWMRALGTSTPASVYNTYPNFRTYDLDNHTSPLYVWMRSAFRGTSYLPWLVISSGSVTYNGAVSGYRAAPACVIC
jgi:hypothetical protein